LSFHRKLQGYSGLQGIAVKSGESEELWRADGRIAGRLLLRRLPNIVN